MASSPGCGQPIRESSRPAAPRGPATAQSKFTTSVEFLSDRSAITPAAERPRGPIRLVTAHCTIIGVDIEGFGQPHRSNTNRLRIRKGLYTAIQCAFDSAGIPWASCRHEDLGDGVLILVPADIPKPLFGDELPGILAEELRKHNVTHRREEKIRLRLAIHAGEINYDEHGFTGASIIHTFRLLEAAILRQTLADNTATLAIISSSWFFEEVIRHSENSCSAAYRRADINNKETSTQAWIRLISSRRTLRRRRVQVTESPGNGPAA